MQQALDAKFAKYPAIAETLASTHPRKLIYECLKIHIGVSVMMPKVRLCCQAKVFTRIQLNLSLMATFSRSRYVFLFYCQPVYCGHLYIMDSLTGTSVGRNWQVPF